MPKPKKRKRKGSGGRPAYKPNDRDREKVEVLIASGMLQADIAAVMGVTEPTMKRHFAAELRIGALKKRADMLVVLNRTAMKGNVPAIARAFAIMDRAELEKLQSKVRSTDNAESKESSAQARSKVSAASTAIGKKVQADIDAHNVVTIGPWAELVRPPQAS